MTDEVARDGSRSAERSGVPRRRGGEAVRRHSWWIVVGTLGALTILVALFTFHWMSAAEERRDAERWHIHTLDVLLVVEDFRNQAFDILRGERGYLLTDNLEFLKPYESGRAKVGDSLRRLEALVSDNRSQKENTARLQARLDAFTAVIDRAVELARQGDRDAALAIVRARQGRDAFQALLASLDAVEREERSLLIARRAALDATNNRNMTLGYAAAALFVLLLAVASFGALAALRAQRRAAKATEELRRLASVDELTGLPNRRHFLARVEEEMARARRGGSPLCLAILDIDYFKRINDRHGHVAGDAVLRDLAPIIREKIRLGDSAARLGGEEFALLLPNTSPHQARLVCDRLRAAVAARLFEIPGGGSLRVTLSTGVALLHAGEEIEELMRRSDEALYEAKAQGRNQVRLAA